MALQIIQDEPNKYHFKTKDDQRVGIEHRDRGIVLNLFKWGEEVSLQINLNIILADTHQFQDNKIEIDTTGFALKVYPIDARSTSDFYGDSEDDIQCNDGGLRFEIFLKGKPPVNSFTIPIAAKNLRFSYQPFLTQEDIDAGVRCPLNVEGSYAVYHISKKHNEFKTGKMGHWYRPIAEDALGVKAWCAIHIDKYIDPTSLTITIPQQFLDEATYPINIDPDFGYTAIGANWTAIASGFTSYTYRVGSAWTMPAPGGTANYIRARLKGDGNPTDCKAWINQKDSGGAGTHGQIAGPVENLACIIAEHWEEFTLGGEGLTSGVVYILNIDGDWEDTGAKTGYTVAYDLDGATAIASYEEIQTYCSEESPWVVDPQSPTRDHSIYCNYTAAAGWTGKISGVTNPAEIAGVAAANIAEVKGVA